MNSRIVPHLDFLKRLLSNLRLIKVASNIQLSILVEILFNVHKIPFTRSERNAVAKFLPIIRYIGKIRKLEKAREFLLTFSTHFLRTIVSALIRQ